jgi:hypothetical protein
MRVRIVWEVTWSGGGQTGTIPDLSTRASALLRVQESQAVVVAPTAVPRSGS